MLGKVRMQDLVSETHPVALDFIPPHVKLDFCGSDLNK